MLFNVIAEDLQRHSSLACRLVLQLSIFRGCQWTFKRFWQLLFPLFFFTYLGFFCSAATNQLQDRNTREASSLCHNSQTSPSWTANPMWMLHFITFPAKVSRCLYCDCFCRKSSMAFWFQRRVLLKGERRGLQSSHVSWQTTRGLIRRCFENDWITQGWK